MQPQQGLKIRVFSGAANVLRLRALGGYPVMLPFADVPIALSQGTVDAIESTAETVATGQLWDAGLRVCFRQQTTFVQYIPLISGHFWQQASPRLRVGMVRLWNQIVDEERLDAANRQLAAIATCIANGMTLIQPSKASLEAAKNVLLPLTDRFIATLGIDPELAQQAFAGLR